MEARAIRGEVWPRLVAVVVGISIVVTAIVYANKAVQNRSAFLRWRNQILLIDDGVNIYERFQYPNPPIMAMLLTPLAQLPPLVGALTWFGLKVLMAAAALWAGHRLLRGVGPTGPSWAMALAVLLTLRPLIGDLTHGNVNILVLFLVSAALFAYHRSWDGLSGVLLALAICCKVTPLLFVPYFAWKRAWKVLVGTAIGMVAFLFVIPAAWLGWKENQRQLESWTKQMIVPFVAEGIVFSEHPNQSLPGVAFRLLSQSPSFTVYPEGRPVPAEYHNLLNLPRDWVKWLIRAAQAGYLLAMMGLCHAPKTCRRGWPVVAEFSFILVGMLILSERTWKHHCVILAWPIALIVYACAALPMRKATRWLFAGAFGLAMVLQFSAGSLGSKRFADLAQVYGVYLVSFMILLGLVSVVLVAARRVMATGAPSPMHLFPADIGCDRAADLPDPARIRSTRG